MRIHSTTLRQFNGRDYKGTVCPTHVPDEMLNEDWAYHIHRQTLKGLDSRGGMGVNEILMNIKRLQLHEQGEETVEMCNELKSLIELHINQS